MKDNPFNKVFIGLGLLLFALIATIVVLALLYRQNSFSTTDYNIKPDGTYPVFLDIDKIPANNDSSIKQISIDGNILSIVAELSGCGIDHQFGLYISQNMADSYPPMVSATLYHPAPTGPICLMYQEVTLKFDLTEFIKNNNLKIFNINVADSNNNRFDQLVGE